MTKIASGHRARAKQGLGLKAVCLDILVLLRDRNSRPFSWYLYLETQVVLWCYEDCRPGCSGPRIGTPILEQRESQLDNHLCTAARPRVRAEKAKPFPSTPLTAASSQEPKWERGSGQTRVNGVFHPKRERVIRIATSG